MAVEHDRAGPRKPAGRHRRATGLTVAGQVRNLASVRPPAPARHRATGRRIVPKAGGPLGMALETLAEIEPLAWLPVRLGSADAAFSAVLPEIQFDIDGFVPPAQTIDGLEVQFHPVHTVFLTATLLRAPGPDDQQVLAEALAAVEATYPFRPEGVFVTVAYGLPYFRRLPGGMTGPLVFRHLPRLRADTGRFVLEEAAAGGEARVDTDDLLITLRSDKPAQLRDVIDWLRGSNLLAGRAIASPRLSHLLAFTSSRAMFTQVGLVRKIATAFDLPYAAMLDFRWSDWVDPAAAGGGDGTPARSVTFAGAGEGRASTAAAGDYFDDGAIQQLTHTVLDLEGHYAQGRRRALAAGPGGTDGGAAAGGAGGAEPPGAPSRLRQVSAAAAAEVPATSALVGSPPAGSALVGSPPAAGSPAAGSPAAFWLPVQGPGFDALDVPEGIRTPKVHAGGFFPTAEAADDGQAERFATVTRRQNFLVPPRRHRAFPLAEFLR